MHASGRTALIVLTLAATGGCAALAQQALPSSEEAQLPSMQPQPDVGASIGGGQPGRFIQVPVSHLSPNGIRSAPDIKNPAQGDPKSAERGMRYFIQFNCVGCHAPAGGGGMGPALSNNFFIYGSQPANIYLSIYQGRPNGMPAWGATLPDTVIWDLVTYIGKISNEPTPEWGRTFSASPLSPAVEQIPAEKAATPDPWAATTTFKQGQKP
ncbi:FixP1 Di-heme cytochrome c (fragment) [Bradyrhizobium sp. STM 3843]|uniref:c-type cytochrome n=1 Tax=Bradyrhizobium sp. STM 3843 TaxID=551947 RepID=UPI00024049D0